MTESNQVEVRVLVDHNPMGLKCDTVARLDLETAIRLSEAGIVDEPGAALGSGTGPETDPNAGAGQDPGDGSGTENDPNADAADGASQTASGSESKSSQSKGSKK